MTVLVGLGNPGRNYSDTKHNFGFWVLDKFAEKRSLKFQAGKGDYLLVKSNDIALIKPTTYMNNSGMAVADYCRYFQNTPEELLVVYDDIDLPLGTLRFKPSGGSGGHKGMESIIYQLESEDFNRLRIGISAENEMGPSERYVLSPFPKDWKEKINEMIEKACDGIDYFLTHDMKETMNKFNENTNVKGIDG
ncbi:MAG: aminoacyl-tRNA hydrolase [Candidatus Marinimicrobia bacterium]|nr:aminoacyl-tRNA hydrolase [Candidatus Neomarinimicrobiota bacterium]